MDSFSQQPTFVCTKKPISVLLQRDEIYCIAFISITFFLRTDEFLVEDAALMPVNVFSVFIHCQKIKDAFSAPIQIGK